MAKDKSKTLLFENCLHNLCYPYEGLNGEDLSLQNDAKEIFLDGLRFLGNLLTALPRRTSGEIEAANRILISSGIDDLLLAFHAICTGYYSQAQNLLRPIIESYNLIKLFKKNPAKIKPWLDGGKSAKRELAVAEVRRILYDKSLDPFETLYSFLCEVGSHPRFAGSKSSVVRKNPLESENKDVPNLINFIGGKRLQPFHSINFFLCILMILPLFLAFIEVYPDIIRNAELDKLRQHLEKIFNFGKQYSPSTTGRDEFVGMLNKLNELMMVNMSPN